MNQATGQIAVLDYEELDSTNLEARRLADSGREGDFVVSAIKQNAGRGRFGRAWHVAGVNVAMTICARRSSQNRDFSTLPLMTGIAIHKVLDRLLAGQDVPRSIKWPNDILLNGAKLSGTLIEADADRIYVGIGVNLEDAPQEVIYPTAYLHQYRQIDRKEMIQLIADSWFAEFRAWQEAGFAPLAAYYEDNLWGRGTQINLYLDAARSQVAIGICRGVDATGRILLEMPDGELRAFSTGDVGGFAV